jgi:hypothetical protein
MIFKYIMYLQTYVLFPFNKQAFQQPLKCLAVKHQFHNNTHLNFWHDTHTLNKQSFVDNMHSGGSLPASCAILWSNEVYNRVVCHTKKSGRKERGFKRHFWLPTGKKMKTGCSYPMIPLCQTTWCYTQQDNRFCASFFPIMRPVWSKMTCWGKNYMIILHHLEWNCDTAACKHEVHYFQVTMAVLKILVRLTVRTKDALSAVPAPTNNHHWTTWYP